MNRSELSIVIILRVIGVTGLFAIPAIFLPYSWMNAIHEYMGLGELPDAPIVSYLARSLSAFYAIVSTITLFVSFDIRRYRSFVKLWAIIVIVTGFVLLGIDVTAGMLMSWTLGEGPPTIVVGLVVLWLQRKITVESDIHPSP
ncbi:MAG: hypothetical protein IH899_15115 [Planctomycetes bacterium]|nr:hypothetical protein [Planctomycetota bacterium]